MVKLDSWQAYEIKRLKLKEFLTRSQSRMDWHQVAKKALEVAEGNDLLAAEVVGVLAGGGVRESIDLMDHIRDKNTNTDDEKQVRQFFTKLWGPCVILDYQESVNRRGDLEQG